MKHLISTGLFLIVLGFLLVIAGSLLQESRAKQGGTGKATGPKIAVGGFIGPVPFGWANDKRLFYPLVGLLAAMMIFWIVWQMMQR